MAIELPVLALIIILPFSFSLVLLSLVRKMEIFCREPWAWVFSTFIYGATIAVFLSIFISEGAFIFLGLLGLSPIMFTLATASVVAPVVEESVKASLIISFRPKLTEVENGIIYGAAVGLGFSATENVFYFLSAYYGAGVEALLSSILLRFITSTFLHLGASGLVGYGIGLAYVQRLSGTKSISWVPFLLAAIGLHAVFNFLSYLPAFISEEFVALVNIIILFALICIVWLLFVYLRKKIQKLDRTSGCAIEGAAPPPQGPTPL